MNLTRVALADDHALVRAGLRKLLESMAQIEVVGEVGDGMALLALLERARPDIVLMDITMPRLNGLDATDAIVKRWPLTKVIILSMYENEEYVSQALANGAVGYLLKDSAPDELQIALLTVLAGRVYLSPAISQDVIGAHITHLRSEHLSEPTLSPRQREVVALIAKGNSNKEIARQLNLSTKTVETHRSRVMQQLNIHEVTGLVHYAIRTGIIESP